MFKEIILKSAASKDTKENILSDGKYQCMYQELLDIFAAFDGFFTGSGVLAGECFVMICGNSLPEALLLLWMLYRKRDVFLLPRGGPVLSLPEFCQHKVWVDLNTPDLEIKAPGTYLHIETNPDFKVGVGILGSGGSVFLKTSGSTAEPKLVKHTPGKFAGNAANCVERFGLNHRDRIIIPVPLYHMYGLGAGFLPGVIAGASINLLENTNIIKYLDREKQYKPNVAFLTPVLCNMFLQARKKAYHYRLVVTAGDRITPGTFTNFEIRFGTVVNLYGSTELGAIATSKSDDPLDLRANGIIETLPGVTIEFTDRASKNNPGTVSEIICSHDYGFDAYVDKKGKTITKETAKSFRSKDLGKWFAESRFQVVGRIGNSINRSGILVAFSEVESLMEQGIEELAHAVVTAGQEDSTRGKKMIAWCELKPNTHMNHKDLRSRCFDIMLRHMVPDEVRIIPRIPRLSNGKFDRKSLNCSPRLNKKLLRGVQGGGFLEKSPPGKK